MTLAALGVLCVILATGGGGWLVARRLRARPDELAGLQAALSILRTEIEYGHTPLADALERAAHGGLPPVAGLFVAAARLLRAGGALAPEEAWTQALSIADPIASWAPDDVVVLTRLGAALGGSGPEDQVRHIEGCVARLRLAEERARSGLEARARMWLYLGVLAGAGLALSAAR